MVVQLGELPFDQLKAVLLDCELGAHRRQLPAGRLQRPPTVFELPFPLLELGAVVRLRRARLRSLGLGRGQRALKLGSARGDLFLRGRQRVAIDSQCGAILL